MILPHLCSVFLSQAIQLIRHLLFSDLHVVFVVFHTRQHPNRLCILHTDTNTVQVNTVLLVLIANTSRTYLCAEGLLYLLHEVCMTGNQLCVSLLQLRKAHLCCMGPGCGSNSKRTVNQFINTVDQCHISHNHLV